MIFLTKVNSISVSILVLTISSLAIAALPSKTSIPLSTYEILSMPEKNREIIASSQKDKNKLYSELKKIADNSQETMAMRWRALTLSSLVNGAEAEKDLKKSLKSEEWFIRNASLLALERISPRVAEAAAKDLMSDKALVVRSAAVKVYASNMNAQKREYLWEEFENPKNYRKKQSLWIRAQILSVLAESPDKRELPLFMRSLRDKDSRLHVYGVQALEKIQNKKLGKENGTLAEKRGLWLKAKL